MAVILSSKGASTYDTKNIKAVGDKHKVIN